MASRTGPSEGAPPTGPGPDIPGSGPARPRSVSELFEFVACLGLREFVGVRAEDERQLADLIEQARPGSIYHHTHAFLLRLELSESDEP